MKERPDLDTDIDWRQPEIMQQKGEDPRKTDEIERRKKEDDDEEEGSEDGREG